MSIKPQVQEAEMLIKEGKRGEAIPLLMATLRADRDDEYAWRLLLQAVDKPEHREHAQAEIERIQRSKSQLPDLTLDYELPGPEALPEKPKRTPSDAAQLLADAGEAIRKKDYAQARSMLNEVLRLEPGNPTAQRWLDRLDDEQTFGSSKRDPILIQQKGPGCIVQFLWFVFIGWWLGLFAIWLGYALLLTIILLPIGLWVLNNIPQVMTLRKPPSHLLIDAEGRITDLNKQIPQRGFTVRALWFVLVGWWLTGLWLHIAYLLSMFLFTMPLGFWMFDQVPAILTLRRLPPRRIEAMTARAA